MSGHFQLYLIRHAQSANNALPEAQRIEDPGITSLGVQQAELLAERLEQIPFTHVFTSGFRRALETTRPLAKRIAIQPSIRTEIHEVGGCYRGYIPGQLHGRPGMNREALSREFPGFVIPADIDVSGWWKSQPYETHWQATSRAQQQAARLRDEFCGTSAVVGCIIHADFKDLMLAEILGEVYREHAMADLKNTGVTRIDFRGSTPEVVWFNDTSHLGDELKSS